MAKSKLAFNIKDPAHWRAGLIKSEEQINPEQLFFYSAFDHLC